MKHKARIEIINILDGCQSCEYRSISGMKLPDECLQCEKYIRLRKLGDFISQTTRITPRQYESYRQRGFTDKTIRQITGLMKPELIEFKKANNLK